MIIKKSPAFKAFKKEVGHANHMLITILVGLDGVIDGNITIKDEFHAAWSPKDRAASARRSKDFAKKSCLVWMVDCLDMYMRLINKSPSVITDISLKQAIDSEENSRSIYKRISLICDNYAIDAVSSALVDVLICWRNKLTHYDADNDITKYNRAILLDYKETIKDTHSGLDVELMLESFDTKQPPTFKEVASLVSASINLVGAIDIKLVSSVDPVCYADQIIFKYLKHDANKRLNGVFSNEDKKVDKSLRQILAQHGFSNDGDGVNDVDTFCHNTSILSFSEVMVRFNKGTFIK